MPALSALDSKSPAAQGTIARCAFEKSTTNEFAEYVRPKPAVRQVTAPVAEIVSIAPEAQTPETRAWNMFGSTENVVPVSRRPAPAAYVGTVWQVTEPAASIEAIADPEEQAFETRAWKKLAACVPSVSLSSECEASPERIA